MKTALKSLLAFVFGCCAHHSHLAGQRSSQGANPAEGGTSPGAVRLGEMTALESQIWAQTFAYSIAFGRALDTAAYNAARAVYLFRGDHRTLTLEDSRAMLQQMRELSSASVASTKEGPFRTIARLGGT